MSTVLLSTIDEKIVYKTQGNVAPYTEGKGNGISFSLSVSKRENVEGSLPLTPTRLESITILSLQAADGPDDSESLDRISSAKVYEDGVSGSELLVSSNSLVKGSRIIKLLEEKLSFKAYTFGFPASKQLVQGKTYTVELLLPDETTLVVDINTGVPKDGNLSKAAFIVKKVDTDYIASNAATPLVEITGSDDVLRPTPGGDDSGPKTDPLDTNSLVYADNIRVEEAKRFIKNIRWRWDVVSERGNKPKNGFRPKMTMRRFAPGAPLNSIRIILDMITDAAPYINPVVSGDIIQGKWKPRVTWFRKDMQQQTYDLRADATVTIIQDLVPDYEDGEGELVDSGGNCSRKEEIEYVWDAAEVSVPPLPYPQGVTYNVQGINRDDESGLFNYMLVKSIAQEQHFGPYIASSSKKSYATREIYKNAYNLPADLPQEGDIVEGGKVTQVNIDVNADCTYDITIVKSYTTKASAVKACSQTIFEHVDSNTTSGNDKALDDAPTASNGVITSHTSSLEDDGTYTNEVRRSEELGVEEAVKQTTAGKFISTTTTADRNQKKEGSLNNGALGTVKNSKTEGGLYNVEMTTYTVTGGDEMVTSKSDIFSSVCAKRVVGTDGKSETYPAVTVEGSTFLVTENMCSVDGSTGAVTRTTQVTAEKSVTDAVVVHSKSIYGVQTSRLDKNCACGCCYTVDTYKPENSLSIGESVRVTKNPGGSADVETSKTEAKQAITIASSGVKTAHTEVTEYSEVKNEPFTCNLVAELDECGNKTGAYVVSDTVGKPACGKVTKWSSCVTEVGTWRTTVTVDKELTVQTRCSSKTTAFATDASETRICNTQAVATESLGTGNAIVTVSSDLTQNDQYCNTTRTITPIKKVWDTVNNSPFNTITRKDFRNVHKTDNTVSQYVEKENCDGTVSFVPTDGAPKYFSTSRTMNEHELFDGCTTTVSAKKATRQAVITQDIDSAQVTVKGSTGDAFSETTDVYCTGNVRWCYTKGSAIKTTSNAQDEFGMKEEQVTVEVPGTAAMDHITYYPTTGTVTEMFKFWNQSDVGDVVDKIVARESVAKALRTGVSIDFARNKFGLYNGSVVITGRTTSGGSGSNSDFESTWSNLNVTCTVSRVFVPKNILNGVKQVIRTYSFVYDEGTTSTYKQAVCCAEGGHSLSIDGFEISTIAKDITLRGHQNKGGYFRKIKSIKLEKDIEIKGMNNQDSLDYVVTTPVDLMSPAKTTTTQN